MTEALWGLSLGIFLGALSTGVYFLFRQQRLQMAGEKKVSDLTLENFRLQESIKALQQTLGVLEQNNTLMSERFESLAQRIFDEKSAKMAEQNKNQQSALFTFLDPLKERLKDFEKKVEDFYSVERGEKGTLRGEINRLVELNQRMTVETSQLSQALRGDVKTQGAWGEFILESVLERSGLRKGHEYVVQGLEMKLKDEEGSHLKPDVVVMLPDQKHLIIDSKVSLVSFEGYISADVEAQGAWARTFTESLRKHVDGLSGKKYYLSEKLISPDFVILFMPVEPAFALAFKTRPELLQEAWDKKVAIVSPTTLLTTLRTVSALWQQERQTKNALEIARRGGALYDKFAALLKDVETLGERIKGTQAVYEQVIAKASQGPGNVIRQMEMLRELGAKAEKQMPQKFLDSDPALEH